MENDEFVDAGDDGWGEEEDGDEGWDMDGDQMPEQSPGLKKNLSINSGYGGQSYRSYPSSQLI